MRDAYVKRNGDNLGKPLLLAGSLEPGTEGVKSCVREKTAILRVERGTSQCPDRVIVLAKFGWCAQVHASNRHPKSFGQLDPYCPSFHVGIRVVCHP